MSSRRQLAAIMFTDIEGYTSIMQRDESAAIEMRSKHRRVFEQITQHHSGKILQYYGDGTLSIFDSAITAVRCGIDLQRSFLEAPSIPVRIGIHLGDIVFDEDGIIGDGVNIASRIESLAQAGSVLISGKVYDEIKNQQDISSQKLGKYKLKNVEAITPVYALTDNGLVVPEQTGNAAKGVLVEAASPRLLIKYWWIAAVLLFLAGMFYFMNRSNEKNSATIGSKSIAVLPFINIGNDPQQEYFSDGITEDILSQLSKIEDLKVISRTTSWGYKHTTRSIPEIGKELGVDHILEGSVRRSENKIRVVTQLISVSTDEQLWAKTYDREITEVFAIQSEIAQDIASLLKAELSPALLANINSFTSLQITAYDYYLKAHKILKNWSTQHDLNNVIELLKQALIEEPDYAEAYADLALAYFHKHSYWLNKPQWVDSALILVNQAIDLNPRLSDAYLARARIYESDILDKPQAAQKDIFKAYELDPNNSEGLLNVGLHYFESGSFEKGIDLIIKSVEVEPDKTDPQIYVVWAKIYEFIDSLDQAIAYYQQAIKLKPDYVDALEELVNLFSSNQRYQEAVSYAERIVKIEATLITQDNLAWAYFRSGDLQAAYDSWAKLQVLEQDYEPYVRIPYKHRLAYVLWQQGSQADAKKLFGEERARLEQVIQSDQLTEIKGEYYDLAGINAFFGQNQLALKWLQRAASEGFFAPDLIVRDPLFDNIRGESQYLKILQPMLATQEREDRRMDPGREIVRKKIRNMESQSVLVLR